LKNRKLGGTTSNYKIVRPSKNIKLFCIFTRAIFIGLTLIIFMENEKLIRMRHSFAHLLGGAVKEIWPDVIIATGPAIDNGFYYDFDFSTPITDKDLGKIEQKMRELSKKVKSFDKAEISLKDAEKLFKGNPYKLELIKEYAGEGKILTTYTSGDFTDLCAGPHVESMDEIKNGAFKLERLAGAYWKGDENNKMLTRIYGLAFATKEELDTYEKQQEEAKKRDHRKLGKDLDLFHMDEKVGLGLPLWHPKGAMLWRVIEDFWYQEHIKNDYDLVRSPHIGKKELWETSGHWGFYNSSMYPPLEAGQTLKEKQEGKKIEHSEEYLLKPMNCPFHVQIYKNSPKSYREFPFRWAECGTVYRFEKKGELSGLTRVRGFTQDDAHILCKKDQVEDELKKVIDFILFIYKSFGFDINSVKVFLSLRDPNNKSKYAGNDEGWNFTEEVLRKVAIEKKLDFTEEKGEAAFYGPKLDFKVKDVLGRLWQCSTLQFDFNLPERFDLTFINSKGEQERPYMLHRALFGSFERFIGLLIEHYAGAFPLWLAPVQIKIIPIRENHNEHAEKISKELKDLGFRVDCDTKDGNMGGKVRDAKNNKIPYTIIIGDKDIEAGKISVESRDNGQLGQIDLKEFIERIENERKNRE
jgi:threonyl-tRNA synthetase